MAHSHLPCSDPRTPSAAAVSPPSIYCEAPIACHLPRNVVIPSEGDACFSPQGDLIGVLDFDPRSHKKMLSIYKADTGTKLHDITYPGGIDCYTFIADSTLLAIAEHVELSPFDVKSILHIYDFSSKKELLRRPLHEHVLELQSTFDGHKVLTLGELWPGHEFKLARLFNIQQAREEKLWDKVQAIACSPVDPCIAIATQGKITRVNSATLIPDEDMVSFSPSLFLTQMCFNASGKHLLAIANKTRPPFFFGKVYIESPKTQCLEEALWISAKPAWLAPGREANHLFLGGMEGAYAGLLELWNIEAQKLIQVFRYPSALFHRVNCLGVCQLGCCVIWKEAGRSSLKVQSIAQHNALAPPMASAPSEPSLCHHYIGQAIGAAQGNPSLIQLFDAHGLRDDDYQCQICAQKFEGSNGVLTALDPRARCEHPWHISGSAGSRLPCPACSQR